jgi:hypothetical protein
MLLRTVFAVAAFAGASAMADPGPSAEAAPVHSMDELAYLVGQWDCRVTLPGSDLSAQARATYGLMFDGRVLKETLAAPGFSGEFLTAYDARSNSFKGVAATSGGQTVVWENKGMVDGRSSEVGYRFGDGQMTPVSRSEFERQAPDHYVVRDFRPKPGAPGEWVLGDTEDCRKTAS